jgi:hypothetical protein
MSSYSRYMSRSLIASKNGATRSGVHSSDVGRTASWASCADFALVLKTFGASGRWSFPYVVAMWPRTASTASVESRTESVRMYVMRPTAPSSPSSTPS